MKKLLQLILMLLLPAAIYAQSARATWPLTNPGTGGTGFQVTTQGFVAADSEYFKNTEINGYSGNGSSQRIRMAGTNNSWPAGLTNQIDSVYVQFTVRPKTSYNLTVDSLKLMIGAASSSTFKANIWYSKDPAFTSPTAVTYNTGLTNNYLPATLMSVTASPSISVNDGETFYLRVYPWNEDAAIKTGKYLLLQYINIYATAEAIPVGASSAWPLYSNTTPVVSGLLDAAAPVFGNNLYLYDYSQVSGTGTNAARITTVSQNWIAETAPDFTRYMQFAAAPKTGGTFKVDSVFFKLGASFSNNLRAGVYYASDSTFADKKVLVADTALVSSNLTSYAFAVSDTINTGESFYLRIYPYDKNSEGWAKLVYVSDVKISGSTTGLAILPATVTTNAVTYVSTTFATAGGNVTADGGGAVSARGVCWDTTAAPTIAKNHTTDGSGTGMFTSSVTGLTPGVTYYLRAYATNPNGTSYGPEVSFTTLAALQVPSLTTTAVTNILVRTATSGGTITNWGGSAVTAKGVCWSTSPNPVATGSHSSDGTDIASFASALTNLSAGTQYYVRAYAVNSSGTGYGDELTFTTQNPQKDTTVVVDKNGTGNYTTVQAAFNAVPTGYTGKWTIFVKKGVYYEKDTLAAGKVNVILVGEDRDSTIITYDDFGDRYGPSNPGTSGTFTITIDANDFIAKNITFRNTYSPQPGVSGTQAVALRANGDRQEYINVKMLGFQDTYYTWGGGPGTGRLYHKNCFIEGTVDFIFGRDVAVFDSCTIHVIRNNGTLTAASTDATSKYGYVFRKCTIISDSIGFDGAPITAFYLGRPWQASPRTVFLWCNMPANLAPAGWQAWNVTPGLYGEYQSFGPGAAPSQRVNWSSQLSDSLAYTHTLSNIFAKSSAVSGHILYDWMPENASVMDNPLPVELTSFTASAQEQNVNLNWQTVTEKNNRGFHIERKAEGKEWESAGFIEGHGTSSEPFSYSFTDKNVAPGKYTYRLKQVDYDGSFGYSPDVQVEVSLPRTFKLEQNYPNPFNPATIITYQLPEASKVTLKIYDVLGKDVATLVNEKKEAGLYRVEFNAGSLASGFYIYRITAGNYDQSKKMMLIK